MDGGWSEAEKAEVTGQAGGKCTGLLLRRGEYSMSRLSVL